MVCTGGRLGAGPFCVLSAIAQTLDLGYLQLSFLAEVSRYNQIKPV